MIPITRWREDPTRDDHGSYIYLRDVRSGAIWSAGYQPCGGEPSRSSERHRSIHGGSFKQRPAAG